MKKYTDEYLDGLIKAQLLKRHSVCECCGLSDPLDPAHIVGRSNKNLRWDLMNLIALCRNCHRYYTDHPSEWNEWWQEHYEERITYLLNKSMQFFDGDRTKIREYIKSL